MSDALDLPLRFLPPAIVDVKKQEPLAAEFIGFPASGREVKVDSKGLLVELCEEPRVGFKVPWIAEPGKTQEPEKKARIESGLNPEKTKIGISYP